MSDPTPTSRSPWPYVVALLICIAGFLAAFGIEVFGPSAQVDHANEKIAHALSAIVADPYGAGAAALAIVTFLGILWSGWKTALHTPVPTKDAPAPVKVASSRSSTGGYTSISTMLFVVLAALFGAAGCALLLPGCGVSTLQVHATIASLTGTVLDEGCGAVQHERDVEQRAAVDANPTREAAAAAVGAVRLRWDPYLAACNLAVDAQNAWAIGLALFGVSGQFDLARSIALAEPVLRAWDDFVALHPPLPDGVTLPTIPASLLSLVATSVEVTP